MGGDQNGTEMGTCLKPGIKRCIMSSEWCVVVSVLANHHKGFGSIPGSGKKRDPRDSILDGISTGMVSG